MRRSGDPKEALSHEESMNQQKITEAERTQDAPALSESSHQTGPFADAHIKQSHVRFSLPPLPPVELCVNSCGLADFGRKKLLCNNPNFLRL